MPQAPPNLSQIKSVRLDSRAIAALAQRTAVVVACLLAVPDSFALIPGATGILDWALKVLMIWISALVLWYASFLAVVHAVGAINDGITIDGQGIKFWRFGAKVAWTEIKGLVCEEQTFFSRLFAFNPPACRMILMHKGRPPLLASAISCQEIPSFLYSPNDFEQIFNIICRNCFPVLPQDPKVFVFQDGNLPALKKVLIKRKHRHLVLTFVIAVGLVMLLARKATVNYVYNLANKEFKQGNFALAKKDYERATKLDPLFAVAWSNLAGVEFKLGDALSAEQHWHLALKLKPDFVEAKVSLAYLALKRRDFGMAQDLLQKALRLAPLNKEALINMAELNMRLGHTPDAIRFARKALTVAPGNPLATCLIAQGRLRLGYPEESWRFLQQQKHKMPAQAYEGFCALVAGEIQLALGNHDIAKKMFAQVLDQDPQNADALIDLAITVIGEKKYDRANMLLAKASALEPQSPRPLLWQAECARLQGKTAKSGKLLDRALNLGNQDAGSLAFAANLKNALGQSEEALTLAKKSLAIEPVNNEALAALKTAVAKRRLNRQ